jgi:hypothetical protein
MFKSPGMSAGLFHLSGRCFCEEYDGTSVPCRERDAFDQSSTPAAAAVTLCTRKSRVSKEAGLLLGALAFAANVCAQTPSLAEYV